VWCCRSPSLFLKEFSTPLRTAFRSLPFLLTRSRAQTALTDLSQPAVFCHNDTVVPFLFEERVAKRNGILINSFLFSAPRLPPLPPQHPRPPKQIFLKSFPRGLPEVFLPLSLPPPIPHSLRLELFFFLEVEGDLSLCPWKRVFKKLWRDSGPFFPRWTSYFVFFLVTLPLPPPRFGEVSI